MKNIVVIGVNFQGEQKKRLEALGKVTYWPNPSSSDEFLQHTKDANIICSNGSFLLENLPKLRNVFVTYPYIELGAFDSEELKNNGVFVANTQGSNRDSIVEWVIFMILSLFRKFPSVVRVKDSITLEFQESLNGKRVLIVGKGCIGTKIGLTCEAFGMNVDFFKRGDNLSVKSKDADVVINSLNCNSSSKNLLNEEFFMSLRKGTYFISFVRLYTYDLNGLNKAIEQGIVAGAAIDCDPETPGDTSNKFYQTTLDNPKILVTPHIAFSTRQAIANGAEFALQNIEAFAHGTPKNVLTKK